MGLERRCLIAFQSGFVGTPESLAADLHEGADAVRQAVFKLFDLNKIERFHERDGTMIYCFPGGPDA